MEIDRQRWQVAFLSCLLLFGCYFAYDVPAAATKQFQEHLNMTDTEFTFVLNSYYTMYSLPNIALPPLVGIYMDRGNLHFLLILLASLVCVGQIFFTMGIAWKWNWLALTGRLVLGIGGESLGVAQSKVTAKWFTAPVPSHPQTTADEADEQILVVTRSESIDHSPRRRPDDDAVELLPSVPPSRPPTSLSTRTATRSGSNLALVMGLNLAVGRLGSVVGDFLSPVVATAYLPDATRGVIDCLLISVLMCVISLLAAYHIVRIDMDASSSSMYALGGGGLKDSNDELDLSSRESRLSFVDDVRSMPLSYWIICVIMVFSYGTVIPFNTIHSSFLQYKYAMDPVSAAQIMAIPDTLSMILSPFTGSFVDRFGYRVHTLAFCGVLLTGIHFSLGFSSSTSWFIPYVPLFFLGISYAFLLLFWPMMPLVVPASKLATAFGVGTAILNLSLTISPIITALCISLDPTYLLVEMFFAACGLSTLALALWLLRIDRRVHNNVLMKTAVY